MDLPFVFAYGVSSETNGTKGLVISASHLVFFRRSILSSAKFNALQSNPAYITYIIAGCVVLEFVYGKAGDAIFNSINRGVSLGWYRELDRSECEAFLRAGVQGRFRDSCTPSGTRHPLTLRYHHKPILQKQHLEVFLCVFFGNRSSSSVTCC